MSSILRPKKKKVLSPKKVWKGITNTPRACLDTVVRYIRRPTYPAKLCFFSGRSQEKRGIIFMQEEEGDEQRQNPTTPIIKRMVKPEAASSFVDDSINRERFELEKENSSHAGAGDDCGVDDDDDDDSIFEDFIQRNRERFRLEKENSLDRLNYYALLPRYAYFDPDY